MSYILPPFVIAAIFAALILSASALSVLVDRPTAFVSVFGAASMAGGVWLWKRGRPFGSASVAACIFALTTLLIAVVSLSDIV